MHRHYGLVLLAVAAGCTNRVTEGSGGSTGSTTSATTSTSAATTSATSPVTVSSVATTTNSSSTGGMLGCVTPDGLIVAMNHIYAGDKDPNGTTSSTAWEQYGLNIDGLNTTNNFAGHCQPNSGGTPSQAFLNGNAGIDNSFGHNIVPLLGTVAQGWSDNINMNITAGDAGYFFDLVGATIMPDQTGITTRFYSGDQLGYAPKFDGTDCWPVDGATVNNPNDITSAKVVFSGGSLASNVWTSGPPQTLSLTIAVQGAALTLTLHHAVVQAPFTVDHKGTVLGQISGVLGTEEFVNTVKQLAGTFDPSLCSGSALMAIESQIRQASDIMVDGTQDPNQTCNGISIGLGFTAKQIKLGGVGPASPPPATPCP